MPRFQRSRHLVGPASAWRAPATGVASADELVGRTLSWFAVAALAYRLAITPILVAGVALHLLMARLNGAVFDFDGWMTLAARIAALALAFVVAWMVFALARQGGRAAVAEGLRAGQEAERARLLRETHDTVLQTLEAIALYSRRGDATPAERLREIRATALQQATELRAVLREDTVRQGGLAGGLRALT